jgi:hypothetical protein
MRMSPAPRTTALVCACAVGLELLAGIADHHFSGSVGMGAPLLGMVLGVVLGLVVGVRTTPGWLTRESLRRLAVEVGGVHFALGGALWGLTTDLAGSAVLLGVGAIGLLVGLSALIVTMCAGDAVAMVFCPFPDPSQGNPGGGPAGPWRRR